MKTLLLFFLFGCEQPPTAGLLIKNHALRQMDSKPSTFIAGPYKVKVDSTDLFYQGKYGALLVSRNGSYFGILTDTITRKQTIVKTLVR